MRLTIYRKTGIYEYIKNSSVHWTISSYFHGRPGHEERVIRFARTVTTIHRSGIRLGEPRCVYERMENRISRLSLCKFQRYEEGNERLQFVHASNVSTRYERERRVQLLGMRSRYPRARSFGRAEVEIGV